MRPGHPGFSFRPFKGEMPPALLPGPALSMAGKGKGEGIPVDIAIAGWNFPGRRGDWTGKFTDQ